MTPLLIFSLLISAASALTNSDDATALQTLYGSLNTPGALTSWVSSNGDPCGQSWKGIVCAGSAVTEINLSGLGLNGQLSYNLGKLTSLHVMDLSNNQLSGNIPYSLPPNLQTLNLGRNNLAGELPYSISAMTSLVNLYVGNNRLTGSLQDMFSKLGNLSVLDMSFNNMSGQLPQSISTLYSLSSLYLQNNHFTGDLNTLANLNLQNLNVENNQFSGWIPASFSSIPNLQVGGNSFSSSPAPPPPPFTPPPPVPTASRKEPGAKAPLSGSSEGGKKSALNVGAIAGIVLAFIVAIIIAGLIAVFLVRKSRRDNVNDEEKMQSTAPVLGSYTPDTPAKEKNECMASLLPPESVLKPPPSEGFKEPVVEKVFGRKASGRRGKNPISASGYSVADLQLATNSFSQEQLIGAGALGSVYRGELPNGKLLAVKKIDQSSSLSIQEEEFTEFVSSISRLRHANLAELVGYCAEHGQRLLVYEYFRRGTLSDTLHSRGEDSFRSELTWNNRVKIALGMARALEYLHEVCQPAVVHKNFKSAKILLDEELNPHLSDCGIAVLSSNPELQGSTALGYSAPECTMSGVYTWQSDVYSFGVVMLELLTGRRPMDSTRPRAEQSLVRW
eukprot:c19666_g2_i1 orf=206-2053(+)